MVKPQNHKSTPGIHWLPDKEFRALQFHTRGQVGDILFPLRKYGQGVLVDGCIEEIMQIIERSWDAIRGQDKPVILKSPVNPRWEDEHE